MAKLHSRRGAWLFATVVAFALAPMPVFAEARGFGINRFEPAAPDSRWFSLESIDYAGALRPAGEIVGDYDHKPQQAYAKSGAHQAIVDYQLALHAGASLTIRDRYRLSANLPVYVSQSGKTVERFDATYAGPNQAGVGDLRLGADARFLGKPTSPLRLGLGFRFWIPTGSAEKFTGDGKYKLSPYVNAAFELGPLEYAANLGYLHRGRHQSFVLTPIGDEITFGAGVGVRMLESDALFVGPELQGSYALSDTGEIPNESRLFAALLVGAKYRTGDVRMGLAGGPGLSHAAGTPQFRALASLAWVPR